MRRSLALLLSAAAVSIPAAAMPPPVPVTPILIVDASAKDATAKLRGLIQLLGDKGYFAPGAASAAAPDLDACRALDADAFARCAASRLPDDGASVIAAIDRPGWRSAALRVRCVGHDPARARDHSLHLADALGDNRATLGERAALAGCMIGALHAPPRTAD